MQLWVRRLPTWAQGTLSLSLAGAGLTLVFILAVAALWWVAVGLGPDEDCLDDGALNHFVGCGFISMIRIDPESLVVAFGPNGRAIQACFLSALTQQSMKDGCFPACQTCPVMRRLLLALLVSSLSTLAGAQTPPTCGPSVAAPVSTIPLPAVVSGRVAFYAALYDPQTYAVRREVALGAVNDLHPLASLFKPLVVQGVLRDVDRGVLQLNTHFTTTAANRSIEAYPAGTHTLRDLARRALVQSDNTASDILHLTYGPTRLAREVRSKSPCTTVLLTTKAWWTAQAGLAGAVLGPDVASGAADYAAQDFESRLKTAAALIAAARSVTGPAVETGLDVYFHGPTYTPDLELELQNTSTAKAYTELMVRTMPGVTLQPATRRLFREMLSKGCCVSKAPLPGQRFWGAKPGSGWRILNLTGVVETPQGLLGYTYMNDLSDTLVSESMERQIKPLVRWIDLNLRALLAAP